MNKLAQAEMIITRAQSLHTKFNEERHDVDISDDALSSFVSTLLDQPEVDIVGAARGPLGIIIQRLFATAQKVSGIVGITIFYVCVCVCVRAFFTFDCFVTMIEWPINKILFGFLSMLVAFPAVGRSVQPV